MLPVETAPAFAATALFLASVPERLEAALPHSFRFSQGPSAGSRDSALQQSGVDAAAATAQALRAAEEALGAQEAVQASAAAVAAEQSTLKAITAVAVPLLALLVGPNAEAVPPPPATPAAAAVSTTADSPAAADSTATAGRFAQSHRVVFNALLLANDSRADGLLLNAGLQCPALLTVEVKRRFLAQEVARLTGLHRMGINLTVPRGDLWETRHAADGPCYRPVVPAGSTRETPRSFDPR